MPKWREQLQRVLQKQGLNFKLGTKVASVDTKGKTLKLTLQPAKAAKPETLETDIVLVAVGRVPNTEGLGLAEVRHQIDNRGRIVRGWRYETSVPGVYRDRRRDRRAHARAQGGRRRRRRRRNPGGASGARELRRDPERDLHRAGSGDASARPRRS